MLPRQNKRGMEIVFVWIFVILAGAVILAFFVSFSFRHAESSTTVTNIRYLDTVSSIITTFAISLEADKTVDLPTKVEVYFHCDGLSMIADNKEFNKQIQNYIVFGTEKLIDDKILLWTLPWKLPYTITNLIYATSPHIKYFLIYDSVSRDLVNQLSSSIPSRFLVEAVDVNNLNLEKIDNDAKLRSYYKSKFVFFTAPKKLDEISDMETPSSVVEIKPGDYGDVIFYEDGMQKASQHIGKEIIYGAIFVDDYDNYACLLEKTMDKVAQITSLYSEKTKLLAIKSTNQCLYQEIKTTLDKQARFAQVLNIPEVYKISQLLVEENRLLDNQDCSLIF